MPRLPSGGVRHERPTGSSGRPSPPRPCSIWDRQQKLVGIVGSVTCTSRCFSRRSWTVPQSKRHLSQEEGQFLARSVIWSRLVFTVAVRSEYFYVEDPVPDGSYSLCRVVLPLVRTFTGIRIVFSSLTDHPTIPRPIGAACWPQYSCWSTGEHADGNALWGLGLAFPCLADDLFRSMQVWYLFVDRNSSIAG